jgi:tetratricopeptide (TPR) repeat protein
VASDVAIVMEGHGEGGLGDRLRNAVEAELGRAGITLVATSTENCDLVIRIETRVTGAVYFLRGHVGLAAEKTGATLAHVATGDELHKESEFATVMAHKAVAALFQTPTVASLAKANHASQEVAARGKARQAISPKVIATATAKAHYARGTSYYNLNRFREALSEYEAAYLAVQDPPFLYNIAQCYRKLGDDKQAVRFYQSYLRVAPDASNRAEVERRITELEHGYRAAR